MPNMVELCAAGSRLEQQPSRAAHNHLHGRPRSGQLKSQFFPSRSSHSTRLPRSDLTVIIMIKIFAFVNCCSRARCPPAAPRVPLCQVPSTPGCAASSVSSQMVSVAVGGGKKETYEALGNDYGFLGQVTWTILV